MSESGRDRLLTYADYVALPDDGHRYQLLGGELVMTPSPNRWHQDVSREVAFALLAHVRAHDLGTVHIAPSTSRSTPTTWSNGTSSSSRERAPGSCREAG